MKKAFFSILIIAGIASFTACNHASNDSKAQANAENGRKDSANKAEPAPAGMEISGDDAKFAVNAADGGMAEVALGKLAEQKASNSQVKAFGTMMVTDHSKANAELKQLASDKKIVLPAALSTDEQKVYDELAAKSGKDFDKAYVKDMLDDHKKDIKEFEDAGHLVKYPEMAAFINKTLPVLKMHLDAVQKISDQMK